MPFVPDGQGGIEAVVDWKSGVNLSPEAIHHYRKQIDELAAWRLTPAEAPLIKSGKTVQTTGSRSEQMSSIFLSYATACPPGRNGCSVPSNRTGFVIVCPVAEMPIASRMLMSAAFGS